MAERKVALVTGASSGIGAEFARQLARRGHDLVVVARDVTRLGEVADALRADHGTETEILPADLADPDQLANVAARLRDADRPVDLLVNNAGFGTAGRFWEVPLDGEDKELRVNVVAVLHLTHAALGRMVERGRGGVINVSSIAAYQPNPSMATYGGTKAFVFNFTQAVHEELAGTGVKAMVLCPGFTRTEFQERAGVEDAAVPGPLWMSAEQCVSLALHDFDRGKAVCVPGVLNTLGTAFISVTPSFVTRKVAGRVMKQGSLP
jgi:short-subunit dehydrogenase